MNEIRKINPDPKIRKPNILDKVPLLIFILKNGNLNKDFLLAIFFIVMKSLLKINKRVL
jgi:hypothetical protein